MSNNKVWEKRKSLKKNQVINGEKKERDIL